VVKKLIATSAAGLGLMISTMSPALASTCEASTQTVTRTAGSWSSLSGPIVNVTVDPSGLSWTVGPDAELDNVMLEHAPTKSNGATVSSAVLLPGSATGSVSIAGEADVVVRFAGTACLREGSDDAIVEVAALTPKAEITTAPPAAPLPTEPTVERFIEIRWLCRMMVFPA
jgi:hypothetical protein